MSKSCDWKVLDKSKGLTIYKKAKSMVHPILYKCLNKNEATDKISIPEISNPNINSNKCFGPTSSSGLWTGTLLTENATIKGRAKICYNIQTNALKQFPSLQVMQKDF